MSTSSRVSGRAGTGRARPDHHANRRGFALTDAAVLLAGIALARALALPTLNAWRTDARLAGSRENLRQLGQAHAAYSDANEGFIGGFNWELAYVEGQDRGCGLGPRDHSSRLEAAQWQSAAIMRKRADRCGGLFDGEILRADTLPHNRYSHLPLLDWLGASITDPVVVSPLDHHQQAFQSKTTFDSYSGLPGGTPEMSYEPWMDLRTVGHWTYASSYLTTVYAFTPSRPRPLGDGTPRLTLGWTSDASQWRVYSNNEFRPQSVVSVRFPSNKALMFEEFDYSQGLGNQGRYYADPLASVNVLAFDGSAPRIATADANPGWDPNDTAFRDMGATAEVRYRSIDTRYFPDDWDRPDPYPGYYKWTRGGLEGIDFGAGEINTSDW